MFRGRIVECAATAEIMGSPLHPYTRRLFSSVPGVAAEEASREDAPATEPGAAAGKGTTGVGCPYRSFCEVEEPRCALLEPDLADAGGGHMVACIRAGPGVV
jgi:oligopeptide/dipeptide ABC transporter ATP-binding protein